jgi:hypothetical protein
MDKLPDRLFFRLTKRQKIVMAALGNALDEKVKLFWGF